MSEFVVESVALKVDRNQAYEYIRNPVNLPQWTNAFQSISGNSAVMKTQSGRMEVGLEVVGSPDLHTVDWKMTFPDGTESWAWSRLVCSPESCLFSLILPRPPAALEEMEGTVADQRNLLRQELKRLQEILERARFSWGS